MKVYKLLHVQHREQELQNSVIHINMHNTPCFYLYTKYNKGFQWLKTQHEFYVSHLQTTTPRDLLLICVYTVVGKYTYVRTGNNSTNFTHKNTCHTHILSIQNIGPIDYSSFSYINLTKKSYISINIHITTKNNHLI